MPSLSEHHGSKFVKIMLIGDSGTGKTGSLTSLVKAGYKVRVLDMDNGLDSLRMFVRAEAPDKLANVDYETCRDEYKASKQGPVISGSAKAYVEALKFLDQWSDGTRPAEWGEDTVFVLDSLTSLGGAAWEWAKGMNPGAKEPRTWFYAAQQALEHNIAMLTGENFKCNVVIISHVRWSEMADGTTKGHPNAVGKALGPIISRYVNTLVLAESSGSGTNVKRRIKTMPTGSIDLKAPVPAIDRELPLESGLADLFAKLKEST